MKRTLKVEGLDVITDDDLLSFNEATVNEFLDEFGKNFSYYCGMFAEAEKELAEITELHEIKFAEKYEFYKDQGCTEKQAEAKSKQEVEVQAAKQAMIDQKCAVTHLKGHIRAWEKTCECALNRANTLRKEMDKLNADIYHSTKNDS